MRTALLSVLHLSLTLGPALAQPSAGSPMKWTVKAGDTPGVASCSIRAPGPVNLALVRSEYGVSLKLAGKPWVASRDVVSATVGDVRVSADSYAPLTISLLSRDPSSAQFLRALETAPSISLMQGVRTVVVRLEGTTEGLAALDLCMQQQSVPPKPSRPGNARCVTRSWANSLRRSAERARLTSSGMLRATSSLGAGTAPRSRSSRSAFATIRNPQSHFWTLC